ncbi:hypothetical protein LCGC14_1656250, partial [marine sediment metagenome]
MDPDVSQLRERLRNMERRLNPLFTHPIFVKMLQGGPLAIPEGGLLLEGQRLRGGSPADGQVLTWTGANKEYGPQDLPAARTPSASVVTETAFGQASAVGSAVTYSRGDHTHGTPVDPVTAHAAAADPHTVYGALAQAETWAALQTFNAHIQFANLGSIKSSSGTNRITVWDTSPEVFVTGDLGFASPTPSLIGPSGDAFLRINTTDNMAMGDISGSPNTEALLRLRMSRTIASNFRLLNLELLGPFTGTGQSLEVIHVGGSVDVGGASALTLAGLLFLPQLAGTSASTLTRYSCAVYEPRMAGGPHVITTLQAMLVKRPTAFLYVPGAGSGTVVGADIEDLGHANFDNVYGLRIAALTAGGTLTKPILQEGTVGTNEFNAATVFNEAGADVDFRVEGVGAANALFVQGSDGNVGIGTSTPQRNLHIESGVPTIRLSDSNAATDQAVATLIEFYRGNLTNRVGFWGMASGSNDIMRLSTDYAAGELSFSTGSSVEAVRIDASQNVGISGALTAVSYGGILEANLLDKTAAEIISGVWEFTGASTRLSSTQPILDFNETDGPVDEKFWRWTASIGDLYLQTKTDALGVG